MSLRPTLLALFTLLVAPGVAADPAGRAVAKASSHGDAVDAFFDLCVQTVHWRERRLAAQARSGKASVLDSITEEFPLALPNGPGTLTVYWDNTCRIDAPS